MNYLSNAFSLQMIKPEDLPKVKFKEVKLPAGFRLEGLYSIVGHADTASVLGVKMNRASVMLMEGDYLYVAQLVGGRLPEGCKTLPEGFRFRWVLVEVVR